MSDVAVRYIVEDVGAAVRFYVEQLGFAVELGPAPGFAALSLGGLRLLLNQPGAGGAGQPAPDGRRPEPGGWNRVQLRVPDLEDRVRALRESAVALRGDVVVGRGGSQVLVEDPSGNPVELFQPASR